jgi:hypothetical protein
MNDAGMFGTVFQGMTPEQRKAALAEWVQLGSLGDEVGDLEAQLQQAQALKAQPGQHHTTLAGGLIGGVGDALRQLSGTLQEGRLEKEVAHRRGEQDRRRTSFAELLAQGAPAAAPQDGAPAALRRPAEPYGLQSLVPFRFGGY